MDNVDKLGLQCGQNVFIGLDVDDIDRYGEKKITAAEDHNTINTEDIGDTDKKDDYEEVCTS